MSDNIKSIVGNSIGTMNGNMMVGDTNNNYYQVEKVEKVENRADVNGNNNIVMQGIYNSNVKIEVTISEKLFQDNFDIIKNIATDVRKVQDLHTEMLKRIEAKIDGNSKKTVILTTPPFIPPVFEGRAEELTQVHDKLFAGENFIMLVNGVGGIGKTTFAVKYWEKYQTEYTHLAFLYVENTITDALLSL